MSDIFNHEAMAWDSLNDEYDEPVNYYPKPIICKHCGTKNLKWKELFTGWRLHYWTTDGLKLHDCKL